MNRNRLTFLAVASFSLLIFVYFIWSFGGSVGNQAAYYVDDAIVVDPEMQLLGFDRKSSALIFQNKNQKKELQFIGVSAKGRLLVEPVSTGPLDLDLHNEDDGIFTCFTERRMKVWLIGHGLIRDSQDSTELDLAKRDMAWLGSLGSYITIFPTKNRPLRRDKHDFTEFEISTVAIQDGRFDKKGVLTVRTNKSRESSPFVDARLHSCVSDEGVFFVSFFNNQVQVFDSRQILAGEPHIKPKSLIDLRALIDGDLDAIEDYGANCGYLEADVLQDDLIVLVGSSIVGGKGDVVGALMFFVVVDLESGAILGSRSIIERIPNKSGLRLIRCVSGKNFGRNGFFLVDSESVSYYDYVKNEIVLVSARSIPPILEFRYSKGGQAFFVREKDKKKLVESVDLLQFLK